MANVLRKLLSVVWLRSHSAILTVLLILSVGLNILLSRKVQEVTEVSRLLRLKLDSPVLRPGAKAPEFSAYELDGQKKLLNYAEANVPTVLYVFTPVCHWCARNLGNIRSLVDGVGDRFRFLGVSLSSEDLTTYLTQNKLPFHVYQTPSEDVKIAYGFNSTPSTIVISPSGSVLQYWKGAYSEDLATEVEGYFQVKLPGLSKE
jgi:peroxiredoxin